MRGDDFIGVGYDPDEKLWLLKGESKTLENWFWVDAVTPTP